MPATIIAPVPITKLPKSRAKINRLCSGNGNGSEVVFNDGTNDVFYT
jgi:hypothetical protein